MHICLISQDIFAWNRASESGYATRMLGRAFVEQGIQVTVVVPQAKGQQDAAMLDGMHVASFPRHKWTTLWKLLQQINADIYHVQEPLPYAYLAHKAVPNALHLMTFHEGHDASEWQKAMQTSLRGCLNLKGKKIARENWFMGKIVRRANGRFVSARQLTPKIREAYRLSHNPEFLPTPITIAPAIKKAARPTVCYVGRWDKQDEAARFFNLVKNRPDIHFIAVGYSDTAKEQNAWQMPNLEIYNFVLALESEQLQQIWQRSWILVDTAKRSGLPTTFLEAAANGCALLATSNPDKFASDFGYYAKRGELVTGLQVLLRKNQWRERGAQGQAYVEQVYAADLAVQRHLQIYERLLRWQRRQKPIVPAANAAMGYRNGSNIWPWI